MEAAIGDQQDLIASLEERLVNEQSHTIHIEEKLARNERMLQKLHRVIGSCIHEESKEPKVIELQPVYANEM